MKIIKIGLILFTLCLSGCILHPFSFISELKDKAIVKAGYEKQDKVEKEISELKAAQTKALADQSTQIISQEEKRYNELKANFQQTINWDYGASIASNLKAPKTRLDDIIDGDIKTAMSFGMPPTPEAILAQNQLLKDELDTQKTSNAQLADNFAKAQQEAAKAQLVQKKAEDDLAQLQKNFEATKTQYQNQIGAKQDELLKISKTVEGKQYDELVRNAQDDKIKVKFIAILGGLSILCILGAVWSPVFKEHFGLGAIIFGASAALVWYIQAWMIAVGAGVCLLLLIAWAAKNHYIESKTATNVYRGLKEIETNSSEVYKSVVAPVIASWQTTYDKDGKPIPDPSTLAHVDNVLMKVGDK